MFLHKTKALLLLPLFHRSKLKEALLDALLCPPWPSKDAGRAEPSPLLLVYTIDFSK